MTVEGFPDASYLDKANKILSQQEITIGDRIDLIDAYLVEVKRVDDYLGESRGVLSESILALASSQMLGEATEAIFGVLPPEVKVIILSQKVWVLRGEEMPKKGDEKWDIRSIENHRNSLKVALELSRKTSG